MSLLVLDEHLHAEAVGAALARRFSVVRLPGLRPGEQVLDDRVPTLLRELDRPTLVTIDKDFWMHDFCHPGYCILFFNVPLERQAEVPELLRALFRHPEFRTRAARMGKVARIGARRVDFWEFGQQLGRRMLLE